MGPAGERLGFRVREALLGAPPRLRLAGLRAAGFPDARAVAWARLWGRAVGVFLVDSVGK